MADLSWGPLNPKNWVLVNSVASSSVQSTELILTKSHQTCFLDKIVHARGTILKRFQNQPLFKIKKPDNQLVFNCLGPTQQMSPTFLITSTTKVVL